MARGRWLFIFIHSYLFVFAVPSSSNYNTHWLEAGSRFDKTQASDKTLDIFCHKGKTKYFFYAWQTVTLYFDIKTDNFNLYEGPDPEIVWNEYQSDNSLWSLGSLSTKKSHSVSFDTFKTKCIAIYSKENYSVHIEIKNFDREKIVLLLVGIILFFSSKSLSENSIFFYTGGIIIGITASFMVLIYFISKMFPTKPLVYGSMIGGWAVGLYFFQFLWDNFQPMLYTYNEYVIWYTIIMGFISFIVCYKVGAPKDVRNKNIISWILQAIGFALIYFNCYMIEVSLSLFLLLLIIKYIPNRWIVKLKSNWRRIFPPKRVLLTEEQYREQGIIETAKALEELKEYCSSPECKQWKLMLKLKDPGRLAKFIDGEDSHVSEDEIEEYEKTDFKIRRPHMGSKHTSPVSSTLREEDFTSDDSSISADDL